MLLSPAAAVVVVMMVMMVVVVMACHLRAKIFLLRHQILLYPGQSTHALIARCMRSIPKPMLKIARSLTMAKVGQHVAKKLL